MKKNKILTESQKRQIIKDKQKAIIESFASTFNKIKRIDEVSVPGKFVKVTEEIWNNADPESRIYMIASATDEIDSNNPLIYKEYRELPPQIQGSMWATI